MTAKHLAVTIDSADPAAVILADPQRLQQVFWNLLSNAVKFTPPGGSIHLHTKRVGTDVAITVRDNGQGIAREFLPYVFDMFRQADASPTREAAGMGLGLSLVKRFVELQGGEVSAESAGAGRGATFTCRFPAATALTAAEPRFPRRSPRKASDSSGARGFPAIGHHRLQHESFGDQPAFQLPLVHQHRLQIGRVDSAALGPGAADRQAKAVFETAGFEPHRFVAADEQPGNDRGRRIRRGKHSLGLSADAQLGRIQTAHIGTLKWSSKT